MTYPAGSWEAERRRIWQCHLCGRTVGIDFPSTYLPLTVCTCNYPDSVTQMHELTWCYAAASQEMADGAGI